MRGQDAPFDQLDRLPKRRRHGDLRPAQANLDGGVVQTGALQGPVEMRDGAELRTDRQEGVNRRLVLWPDPVPVVIVVPDIFQNQPEAREIVAELLVPIICPAKPACRPGAPGPSQFFARAPVMAAL
jgi:hypothetical protein